MVVIMGTVIGWPLIRTIMLAFTDASLMGLDKTVFVGLSNFTQAIHDEASGRP